MENSNISRPETLTQRQGSARLNGAAHDSPAGMERESLRTPSKVLQALRRALLDSKNENQQLAEEMTALKEQMDSREMSWEKKHHELLEEKENLAKTLFQAKNDIKGMMNAAKERQQHFDNRCREMDLIMTQKEEEVHSMKKKLHLQRQEITKVIKHWTTEYDQVTKFWKEEHNKISAACEKKSAELESSFERTIAKLHAEWESRFVCQEMAATDLKTVQEDLERKVRQVTLEKSDLIATIKENKKALFDNMVKISQKEVALRKNDTDWRAKYDALEHQFAVKQTSSEKLHQEIEDEWRRKSRQMEEDIKLLMQKNAELQELAGQHGGPVIKT
ncbi:nucleoporin alm1-like [Thunnus albacares]|uniref:nucleoporin alm1-like n=1 Tax=Thunnus albacares TaxID=8236 RepID=UPI001CF62196|nr:nucleoporin alm1-like [Thunnus albacares]